ncbi:hypothetical protein BD413DRAFT_62621 [Trametes elegans]|nr:hypothetical protein BD413DRAFT_62621 [Trametes elegans]
MHECTRVVSSRGTMPRGLSLCTEKARLLLRHSRCRSCVCEGRNASATIEYAISLPSSLPRSQWLSNSGTLKGTATPLSAKAGLLGLGTGYHSILNLGLSSMLLARCHSAALLASGWSSDAEVLGLLLPGWSLSERRLVLCRSLPWMGRSNAVNAR